jgi:hypothetical protein
MDSHHNSPVMIEKSETNQMIKRIFVVAEILARGQSNPEWDRTTLEKCSENQGTVDLEYREYDSKIETH